MSSNEPLANYAGSGTNGNLLGQLFWPDSAWFLVIDSRKSTNLDIYFKKQVSITATVYTLPLLRSKSYLHILPRTQPGFNPHITPVK